MTRLSPRALLTLSLVATTPVLSQSDTIGCADLNCPVHDSTVQNECNVVDRTFINVGAVKVPAVESFPQGLSWVQGFRVIPMRPNRTSESSFYLGTPSQANFSMSGCAVLFTEFNAVKPSEDAAEGTCGASMSKKCSDALLKRAQAIQADSSGDNVCRKLQKDLEENLNEDCKPYMGSSDPITGTGSEAPKPISSSQNSTSNCWPVPDKSSDLTLYKTVSFVGDLMAGTIMKAANDVTPIITVFYPEGKDAQAQITCLKIKDESTKSRETMSSGEDKSGAGSLVPDSLLALAALAISVFITL